MRISDWSSDVCSSDLGGVDGAVIGALLQHGDAKRPFALPGLRVGDQRMVADFLADRRLVQRLIVDRADQAMSIAIGLEEDRCALAEQQGAVKIGRASCRERVCQYV